MNKNTQSNTSIKVFCRVRPLNELEKNTGGQVCLTYNPSNIKIKVNFVYRTNFHLFKVQSDENPYDFAFDGIFGPETAQIEVFNRVAKPVLDGNLNI